MYTHSRGIKIGVTQRLQNSFISSNFLKLALFHVYHRTIHLKIHRFTHSVIEKLNTFNGIVQQDS